MFYNSLKSLYYLLNLFLNTTIIAYFHIIVKMSSFDLVLLNATYNIFNFYLQSIKGSQKNDLRGCLFGPSTQ